MTLNLTEAARLIGVSVPTAWRMARDGRMPGLRVLPGDGRRYRVHEGELRAWLEGKDLAGTSAAA